MSPYRFAFALLTLVACGGKIDPNAEPTRTRVVGTTTSSSGGSSGNTSSSGSSGTGSNGSCYSSALVPFTADFEDGAIGDGFTVNSPSAFSIEWEEPIDGSASLRVKPNAASFIARKVKSVCAARLQFTLRASNDFLKGGGNLARIDGGSRRFTLMLQPGGGLAMHEEIYTTSALGDVVFTSIGDVHPEDPTTITLDVDLAAQKVTYGFYSAMGAGPSVVVNMIAQETATPPAITSVELGTTPGIASGPQGLYWLDDIEIQ
ncbi:MAG: hypothetical protein U0270_01375 [Labilithrix sp.]